MPIASAGASRAGFEPKWRRKAVRAARQSFPFSGVAPWSLVDVVATVLLAAITVDYFYDAIALASGYPLWMDEVLSLWTAQMPSVKSLWSALERGAEFTPPLYDLFLHFLLKAGASSPLALRLPSILAFFLAAIAMGFFVRRYARWPLVALAVATVLSSGMFEYALQVRPYVFVAAVFAWALVIWDRLPHENVATRDLAIFGTLLVILTALHFYAILLVALYFVLEIFRSFLHRSFPRWGVVIAISVALASIMLWWPIMQSASQFSGGDVEAPGYYGRPQLTTLLFSYLHLTGILGIFLVALAAILLCLRLKGARLDEVGIYAALICLVPAGVFIFSLMVSHSYVDRYVIVAALGFSLLSVWVAAQAGRNAEYVALGLLAFVTGVGAGGSGAVKYRVPQIEASRLIEQAQGTLPIATGNGLRYIELVANSSPAIAKRIVYLDLPDIVSDDPTNRHQVERWKVINPSLKSVNAQKFICSNRQFLLFSDPEEGQDDIPRWLVDHANFDFPSSVGASLTLVTSRPCIKS